jgi:hypothetical protein
MKWATFGQFHIPDLTESCLLHPSLASLRSGANLERWTSRRWDIRPPVDDRQLTTGTQYTVCFRQQLNRILDVKQIVDHRMTLAFFRETRTIGHEVTNLGTNTPDCQLMRFAE